MSGADPRAGAAAQAGADTRAGAADIDAAQDRFWNEIAGPLWVTAHDEMELHTGPFGEAALERAAPAPGERVLDVGCGCGTTTIALARAVGPGGSVLGMDLSGPMLERAAADAADAGLAQATFERRDAGHGGFGGRPFDLVFSRFGVMFFGDPAGAFATIRAGMAPSGRLVFVCWQQPSTNPWMTLPNRAALAHFRMDPPAPSGPEAADGGPGPFALADPDRVHDLLASAGFGGIDVAPVTRDVVMAADGDLDHWAEQRLLMGPARDRYLACGEAERSAARTALVDGVADGTAAGPLVLRAAAWVVSAHP